MENQNIQGNINIHKRVFGKKFKKRVSITIKEIKNLAYKLTKTKNVRVEPSLNKFIFSNGHSNPPNKLRLRFSKRLNINKNGTKEYIVFVSNNN